MLRTLGIGTVVFCWGLFTADKGLAHDVATHHRIWIVVTATLAVAGLLFDLLHAVVAYWVADRLRSQMERLNQASAPYPYADRIYKSQTVFFAVKSVLMPIAAVSVVVLLFVMVWTPQPVTPTPPPVPTCCCQSVAAPKPDDASLTPIGPDKPKSRGCRKPCKSSRSALPSKPCP